MPKRTLNTIWWPFVQHGLANSEKDVTVIDSAYSDFFSVYRPDEQPEGASSLLTPEFDGSASWWTQTVGHAHPSLTLAAARASGRYGHVMFPQATHLPALKLAEKLVHDGPGRGWASRAFFTDNGSTGMEVALKMALRAYSVRNGVNEVDQKRLGILGLNGSYHGDTIGAMDACAEGVYSCEWHDAKGFWFDPPSVGIINGQPGITLTPALHEVVKEKIISAPSLSWIYDVKSRLQTPLAGSYRVYLQETLERLERQGQKLGALVIEPLVLGAGGMVFVDPLFQRIMVDVVRNQIGGRQSSGWSGLPVIFDEVFVGLHRIGMESTGPLLGVYPDISVNAKILTGGLLPLAVTLASESIFKAFLGDSKATALLHGHSYTAHAIGCEVANETLKLIDALKTSEEWRDARANWSQGNSSNDVWSFWDPSFVQAVSQLPVVDQAMALGCVFALKLKNDLDSGVNNYLVQRSLTSFSLGYVSTSAQAMFKPLQNHIPTGYELSAAPGGAPFTTHYRTLGDVAYFMTSLNTQASVVRTMEDKIWNILKKA
jgi:dethiobiotin synthetase/adenosylmethionine--8-amino-7-oxononanoate aminotransferase